MLKPNSITSVESGCSHLLDVVTYERFQLKLLTGKTLVYFWRNGPLGELVTRGGLTLSEAIRNEK